MAGALVVLFVVIVICVLVVYIKSLRKDKLQNQHQVDNKGDTLKSTGTGESKSTILIGYYFETYSLRYNEISLFI